VLGNYGDAAARLAEASRLAPSDASALAYLAFAELKLGRPDAARTHAAAALALDPAEPLARQLAGTIR